MAEVHEIVNRVISQFIERKREEFTDLKDAAPLFDFAFKLMSGGKRTRAQFAYWGYMSCLPGTDPLDPAGSESVPMKAVYLLAAGIEFFHAAALVHDDLIDNSDTRRGLDAAHVELANLHRERGYSGDPDRYGMSGAILLGDLLLVWSDELFGMALNLIESPEVKTATANELNRMRTEVTLGQFLDVTEESAWEFAGDDEQLARAQRVLVHKSARYSVEAPLRIGAAMAGAAGEQLQVLSDFGLPLGIAYQLRDDLLGVFGDEALTGKPAGDDLREGKRTVLVALTRGKLPASTRRVFDELLGDRSLTAEQVQMLRTTIESTGSRDTVERMISRNLEAARAALETDTLASGPRMRLRELAIKSTVRNA